MNIGKEGKQMIYSLKGTVQTLANDYIVLSVNNVGYQVYVSHVNQFKKNDDVFLFVDDVQREDEHYLVGFTSNDEKEVYSGLKTVNGIGPKTAIRILSDCDFPHLRDAIEANNILFLRSIKGIGQKSAAQILIDLRGYFDLNQNINVNQYDEVYEALKVLHFKNKQIIDVLSSINIPNASNEEILKEALRRLRQNGRITTKS